MPYKNKEKQLRYMRWWRRNNKERSRDYMREYRAKRKLEKESEQALFNYQVAIAPIITKEWRKENEE